VSRSGNTSGNTEDPAVLRRQGPGSESYAAELLLEEPVLDDFDFESEDVDDEEDDEDDESLEEDDDVDLDDEPDDAGALLEEEPRLSLR
jgi:hypothetical protein